MDPKTQILSFTVDFAEKQAIYVEINIPYSSVPDTGNSHMENHQHRCLESRHKTTCLQRRFKMTEQITPEYLSFATEHHASDIFIIAGRPLSFKINGKLSIYGERLMPADTEILLRRFIRCPTTVTLTVFWKSEMMTFLFHSRCSRFRVNAYKQRGSLAAVIRVIAFRLPDPAELPFRRM